MFNLYAQIYILLTTLTRILILAFYYLYLHDIQIIESFSKISLILTTLFINNFLPGIYNISVIFAGVNKTITHIITATLIAAGIINAVSCSGRKAEAVRLLTEASVLADANPASALTLVEQIDSLHIQFGRKNSARLALVGTKARYKSYQNISEDTLINDAVKYFKRQGNSKELGEALMYQGAVLLERGNTNEALRSYIDAEKALQHSNDYILRGLINTRIGEIYLISLVDYKTAAERQNKALHYFDMTDDIGRITQAHLSLARSLISTESYNEAERHIREGIALAQMTDNRNAVLIGYELISYIYEKQGRQREVIETAQTAVKEFGWTVEGPTAPRMMGNILSACASAYARLGRPDSAAAVAARIDWETAGEYSRLLTYSHIYEAQGNLASALEYHDKAWDMADSLKEAGYRNSLVQAEKFYDYSRTELENERLSHKLLTTWIIVIASVIILALLATVLALSVKRIKARTAQLEKENDGLHKKVDDNTPKKTHLETLGQMLTMTDSLIDTYYRYGSTPGLDEKVKDVLREFLGDPDKKKADGNGSQEKVLELCEAICPGLIARIREQHPGLKPRELMTIACTACGFSTGTTARLRGISESSLYVERSRISTVLGCLIPDYINNYIKNYYYQ